jgi:hypothetical protein
MGTINSIHRSHSLPNSTALSSSSKPQRPTNRLKKPPTNLSSDPETFRLSLFRNCGQKSSDSSNSTLPGPTVVEDSSVPSIRRADPERIQRRYSTVTHSSPAMIDHAWSNEKTSDPAAAISIAGLHGRRSRSLTSAQHTALRARQSLDSSLPTRRRSLLIAPPPATASRPLGRDRRLSLPQLRSTDMYEEKREEPVDKRSGTPFGIPVLGSFKRGSLHITNGTVSPSPSAPSSPTKLGHDTDNREPADTLSAINDTAPRTIPPPLDIPCSKFPARTSSRRWRRHAYSKSYEPPSPLILSPFSFEYSDKDAIGPDSEDISPEKTSISLGTIEQQRSSVHILKESVIARREVSAWNFSTPDVYESGQVSYGAEFSSLSPRYGYGLSGTRSIVVKELRTAAMSQWNSPILAPEHKSLSKISCAESIMHADIPTNIPANPFPYSKITGQEYYQRFSRRRSQLIECA